MLAVINFICRYYNIRNGIYSCLLSKILLPIIMRRILAVDDDKDILDVIQYILEDSGYEVDALSDGNLLFEKIKAQTPDLILLDVMLGNLDGRELCRAVKTSAETRDIPVVMISASHAAGSLDQKGAPDAFIAKPFDIDDLLGVVKGHVRAA